MTAKNFLIIILLFLTLTAGIVRSQEKAPERGKPQDVKKNREEGLAMLQSVKESLKQYYYDKNFRGIDLERKFKEASEKIKALQSNSQIARVIATFVLEFNDSHTVFYPPNRMNRVQYGFSTIMIGDTCYVNNVRKGSDAEKKGLKAGDIIVSIGKHDVSRENLWALKYFVYQLEPQSNLRVTLLNPNRSAREVTIDASFISLKEQEEEEARRSKQKKENPYKCMGVSDQLIACKLETFSIERKYIDKMMAEVSRYPNFILDLRGNGGGYVSIEEYLVGHFFENDVKIGTQVTRKKSTERIAKPQKERNFKGQLAVLIDSESASASEVFSRTMQLEKRARIVGDISAGAVMTSISGAAADFGWPGSTTYLVYGMSITVADLVMSDGNRLENVGVVPDLPANPSSKALAEGSDPVLAYAMSLFGVKVSQTDAGKFKFLIKKEEYEEKENDSDEGKKN